MVSNLRQDTLDPDSHLYATLSMLSLAGLVVHSFTLKGGFFCKDIAALFSDISLIISVQVFVIAFSLGLGAIPWIIMSEVCMGV